MPKITSTFGLPADYVRHFEDEHEGNVDGCRYCRYPFHSRRMFLAPGANDKIDELFDLLGVPSGQRDVHAVGDLLAAIIDAQREEDAYQSTRR